MENGSSNRDHQQQQQKFLDPPSFRLPEDWDESRYELWSVRVPVSLNVNELNGKQINVTASKPPAEQTVLGNFDHDDKEYALVAGHEVENEAFRILQPKNDSDDDDEEENVNKNKMMVPSSIPFARHVNVVDGSCSKDVPDTELAPRSEVAPTPVDPVRHAYAPIPQKSGLKRRWMPPGVAKAESKPKSADTINQTKRKASDTTTTTTANQATKRSKHASAPKTQSDSELKADNTAVGEKKEHAESTDKPSLPNATKQGKQEDSVSEKKKSRKEKKAEKKAKKEKKKEKKSKKKKKKAEP